MSSPMPGWYPDPEAPERQRFWDGTKWTEARAYPASAVGADAGEQLAEVKESRSAWRWIAVIALVAAALLAAAYFILNRNSEPEPVPGPVITDPVTPTGPTQTPTVTPTEPTTPPVTPPVTPTP